MKLLLNTQAPLSICALAFSLIACSPQAETAPPAATTGEPAAPVQAQAAPVAPVPTRAAQPAPSSRPAPVIETGQVTTIEPIVTTQKPSGVGAVAGGVIGGVVGNQFGDGNGRKAATVVGAVGGAFGGNAIEKKRSEEVTGYRVVVRLENGESREFTEPSLGGLKVGDRVQVVRGNLQPT